MCGGGMTTPSFSERFPKWNPRYVAFALSQGATDILAFRNAETDKGRYLAWVAARREEFRLAERIPRHDLTRHQERAFERWLERKYANPTSARTICAEVMDELRGLSPEPAI